MSDYLTQYEYDYQDLINKLNKTDFKQDVEEDQEELNELIYEIRTKEKQLKEGIEDNTILANQITNESERVQALERLKFHEDELSTLRAASRRSILSAQNRFKLSYTAQREILFESIFYQLNSIAPGLKKRVKNDKSDLETTKSITKVLKNTRDIIKEQVTKFSSIGEVMTEDSEMIRRNHNNLHSIGGHIKRADRLLATIDQQHSYDKCMLVFGYCCFCLACLYVLYCRLL